MESKNNIKINNKISASAIAETVIDIFYPKRCICCNFPAPVGNAVSLCSDCLKHIPKNSVVYVEPDRYFEMAVCALPYEKHTRNAMINYKFNEFKYLSHTFSAGIRKAVEEIDFPKEYTIICPVPLHPLRERPYNQSLLIAEELAGNFNLTLYPDLLLKVKNLTPLSQMGYAMRRASICGAIDFNMKYNIDGKKIILVDDIYTTGSTADECAKILKIYGADEVTVFAACYADQKGDEEGVDADNLSDQEFWC